MSKILWYIQVFNFRPSNKVQKYFRVSLMLSSYCFVVVDIFMVCSVFFLQKATVLPYWSITVPICKLLASLCIPNYLLNSILANKLFQAIIRLILSNDLCLISVNLIISLLGVRLVKGCNLCELLSHISQQQFTNYINS